MKSQGRLIDCLCSLPRRIYRGKDREGLQSNGTISSYDMVPPDEEIHTDSFVTELKHPSYVVVTFTSRQAAVIARQCLADGGAEDSWKQIDLIPTYPLAEAPWYNFR